MTRWHKHPTCRYFNPFSASYEGNIMSCLVSDAFHKICSTSSNWPSIPCFTSAVSRFGWESHRIAHLFRTIDQHLWCSPVWAQLTFIPFLYQVKPKNYLLALTFLCEGPKSFAPTCICFYHLTCYLPVNAHGCGKPTIKVDHFPRETTGVPHLFLCLQILQGISQCSGSRLPSRASPFAEPARYRLGLPPDLRRDRSVAAGAQAAFVVLRADGRLVRDLRHHRGGLPRAGALEAPPVKSPLKVEKWLKGD